MNKYDCLNVGFNVTDDTLVNDEVEQKMAHKLNMTNK